MVAEQRNLHRVTDIYVTLAGQRIDDDKLQSFVIEQDLDQPRMCALMVQNQGHHFSNAVTHGDGVEVKVGGASGETLFAGEIVGIEPLYRAGGDSKCVLRAFDKLHRLLRGRKSRTFLDMSDQDICSQIAGDHGLRPRADDTTKIIHEHVYQHNQTDLELLRLRAARIGYAVWVEGDTLFFAPPKTDQDSGVELNLSEPVGDLLVRSFSPRMSSAAMVKKVTVRGWNPERKEEIVGEASATGSKLGQRTGDSAASAFGEVATFEVDHPIFSNEEAQAIAAARLSELLMGYISGELECTGAAVFRPGVVVNVVVNPDAPDDKFNGKYLVTGCTHQYRPFSRGEEGGGGGYRSILRMRRDAEQG